MADSFQPWDTVDGNRIFLQRCAVVGYRCLADPTMGRETPEMLVQGTWISIQAAPERVEKWLGIVLINDHDRQPPRRIR